MSKIQEVLRLAEAYNARVPEVVQDRKEELKQAAASAASPEEAVAKVLEVMAHYYSNIQWSVEKGEWDRLTPEQRQQMANAVIQFVSR